MLREDGEEVSEAHDEGEQSAAPSGLADAGGGAEHANRVIAIPIVNARRKRISILFLVRCWLLVQGLEKVRTARSRGLPDSSPAL